MAKGGKRPGAGRPKGSKNTLTPAVQAAIDAGVGPIEFLLTIMRDPNQSDARRQQAARDVAPYLHAKLANIEHAGGDGGPIQFVISKDDEQL